DDGTQRLVTLATPLSIATTSVDACGQIVDATQTLAQVVFRPSGAPKRGTPQGVGIGTITTTEGCSPRTTSYGSPGDPGTTVSRLDMTLRPSMLDIAGGTQLAGMSETRLRGLAGQNAIRQDVAYFITSSQIFFGDTGGSYLLGQSNGWSLQLFG